MKVKVVTRLMCLLVLAFTIQQAVAQTKESTTVEQHRPLIHFTPKSGWMNDPNGMVYYKGVYHLFYQHYPDKPVWGPMHWGHATSTDLIHWKHQPIALYPDSLGYIFSGSAVVDVKNTTGFGKKGKAPLVAIFTHHYPNAPEGNTTFQNQSLAYSLDEGKTWTKYKGNPVLKNLGIVDFRDPKVMWFEKQQKWVMTLATKDCITFYSSPDLKEWTKESEFGKTIGAHGGVWECPDLFTLDDHGKQVWVLLVNINPGGPNKGSATQYFLGDFDGHQFMPYTTATKWLDYGPDEYAGITWSNTGDRKLFIGWMSNWMYANEVPTTNWRSAATLARELKLKMARDELFVASKPVKELALIQDSPVVKRNIRNNDTTNIETLLGEIQLPGSFAIESSTKKSFSFVLSNDEGEQLVIGFDREKNEYYIDRSKAGISSFNKDFAAVHTAPRFSISTLVKLNLVIDVSSVELFADDGLTVMTEIFFPSKPYSKFYIHSGEGAIFDKIAYTRLQTALPE